MLYRIILALALVGPAYAATLASQVAAIPVGQWRPIATEVTMTSIDPELVPALNSNYPNSAAYRGTSGFKSLWNAWNSGAYLPGIGPCGGIAYMGGGHADYWGNGVVALDLCGAADGGPTWRRLTDPWVAPITWPAVNGAWPDGTPSVPHTYDGLVAGDGKLMLFTTQLTSVPAKVNQGYMLDIASGTWTSLGLSAGADQGASTWDATRHVAWFLSGATRDLTKFDPATRVFTPLPKAPADIARLDSMMGHDPVNDLLVVSTFRYAAKVLSEYSIATGAWTRATQVNAPALAGQHAMQWSATRQAWIVWMDTLRDGKVWEMKRTSVTAGVPTYTWTLLTDAANTQIPTTAAHNGSYDKFQLITVGADEALIGTLSIATGVWAFKLPAVVTADVCAQPGVVACDRFDGKPPVGAIYQASSKLTKPYIKDGVLWMEVVSQGGKDTGHIRYHPPFVGEGGFLAYSYRKMLDAEAIKHEGMKDWILWGPKWAASYTSQQIVLTHMYAQQVPILYRSGGLGLAPTLADGDKLFQNGDFDCRYRDAKNGRVTKCHTKAAAQWARYYVEVRVGHFGQEDTRVTNWVRTTGPWQKVHEFTTTLPDKVALEVLAFMDYRTNEGYYEHPLGLTAFDDIIISTQPLDRALL